MDFKRDGFMHKGGKLVFLLTLVSYLFGCGGRELPEKTALEEKGPPKLELSPAFEGRLDPPIEVAGYLIRPPKETNATKEPNGIMWSGMRKPEGTAPTFALSIVYYPKDKPLPSLKTAFEPTEVQREEFSEISYNKPESCLINGIRFRHAKYKGVEKSRGKILHGWDFVALEDRTLILFNILDADPHHEETFKLGEAVASTIKKK